MHYILWIGFRFKCTKINVKYTALKCYSLCELKIFYISSIAIL